jgi:hypothetical protein
MCPLVGWKMYRTSSQTQGSRYVTAIFIESWGRVTYFWLSSLYLPRWYRFSRKGRRMMAIPVIWTIASQTCLLSRHVLPTTDRLPAKNSVSLCHLVSLSVSHKTATWGSRLFQNQFMILSSETLPQPLSNQAVCGTGVYKSRPLGSLFRARLIHSTSTRYVTQWGRVISQNSTIFSFTDHAHLFKTCFNFCVIFRAFSFMIVIISPTHAQFTSLLYTLAARVYNKEVNCACVGEIITNMF